MIKAEHTETCADADSQTRLRATMRERLRARLGVHPIIELVPQGTVPRSEFKARRVIDDREDLFALLVMRDPRCAVKQCQAKGVQSP